MADITLPQLGETVTEGTITRWFKKVGDTIAADEPLFEVSTDKVDTEVPSPVAGTVTEIRVAEGETVAVGTVIAVSAQRGPRPRLHPLLQRLHRHQHPRLLLHQHRHQRLHLLLLHQHPLLHQHLLSLPRQAKATNCFRQLFDDWLTSTKLQSMH